MNDKVLASWSDCRFYPAKVIAVNRDGEPCNISWMFCVLTFAKVIWRLVVAFRQCEGFERMLLMGQGRAD